MKFELKSELVLKAMNSEELQAYYVEKLNHEKTELEARIGALEVEKDSEAFKSLEKEVKELKDEQFKTLKSALEEQGKVIKGLKDGKIDADNVRVADGSIEKALIDNIDKFNAHAKGESKEDFAFDIKTVGDMTFAANLSGGNMPQAQRLDGINDIAEREFRIYPRVPKLNTSGNTIDWVYETAQEGAAAGTAEGVIKNQLDNNFVVTSVALLKQTAFFKVSTEMLNDVSFMASWLRNKLLTRLMDRIDSQVLVGGGTGTDLNGIYTQATVFAAGTFAGTVDNANDADSLVVAANQIRLADHNGALSVVMHPSDVTGLKLIKVSATDKRYVERLVQVGSTLMLDGMPIIETTAMTAGNFLVGDFSKALIAQKNGISVEVGLDSGDFLKNMRSILAEWRGEVIIQNNDTTAFVYGVFATTNTALETT
jgi:HK97 family phage major capsid protein